MLIWCWSASKTLYAVDFRALVWRGRGYSFFCLPWSSHHSPSIPLETEGGDRRLQSRQVKIVAETCGGELNSFAIKCLYFSKTHTLVYGTTYLTIGVLGPGWTHYLRKQGVSSSIFSIHMAHYNLLPNISIFFQKLEPESIINSQVKK